MKENEEIDLLGTLTLYKKGGRMTPMWSGYWGAADVDGDLHSCGFLFDEKELALGESCEARMRFLFSSHEAFNVKTSVGATLVMKEGVRSIGEFEVTEILNASMV